MGTEVLTVALIGFMLIAALIAVEAKDLLSSVIAVGAAGFALSVIDLLVGAPDLAITQVVVEVIALVLLIRVVLTRRDTSTTIGQDVLRTGAVLLAGGVMLAVVFVAVGGAGTAKPDAWGTMPAFGEPVMGQAMDKPGWQKDPDGPVGGKYLAGAAEQTGAANTVTAILLDYRAYDTLGEATVIFVSILGVYAILRRVGRRGKEEAEPPETAAGTEEPTA